MTARPPSWVKIRAYLRMRARHRSPGLRSPGPLCIDGHAYRRRQQARRRRGR